MVAFDRTDLDFILTQILMAENGQPPVNPHLPFGLREVSGTNNNTVPGQASFGAVDQVLPRVAEPFFQTVKVNVDGPLFDPHPGQDGDWITTSYQQTAINPAANPVADPAGAGFVVDPPTRLISNLISDQSADNPAAVAAQGANLASGLASGFAAISGIERVIGGTGDDALTGDGKANVLAGGASNDSYVVGTGDTVVESAGGGTDSVLSSVSFRLGANVENLTLTRGTNLSGTGNGSANRIVGNGGDNALGGGGGDDTLDDGAGNDKLNGDAGDDVMIGGAGTDTFV